MKAFEEYVHNQVRNEKRVPKRTEYLDGIDEEKKNRLLVLATEIGDFFTMLTKNRLKRLMGTLEIKRSEPFNEMERKK